MAPSAFASGSFLYFEFDYRFRWPFENDFQLRFDSAPLALSSLLKFLDKYYPGPAFFESKAKRLAKIASQWLDRPGHAGRVFWNEDRRHLFETYETEGCELTWPDDENELAWGIKELLKVLAPKAKEYYEVCTCFT